MIVLAAALAVSLPPSVADRIVARARTLVGTPYRLGGRMKKPGDGIDCQGLVFFAVEAASKCGWRSYSVLNVATIANQELGAPVPGLAPVSTRALDLSLLAPGDYLMLVGPEKNPVEAAVGSLDGTPMWVWHTGLYAGGGRWIVADHFAGAVIETDLVAYLREHANVYSGVFATRMRTGPAPPKCRQK